MSENKELFSKMIESYLAKDANTSWVIADLEQKHNDEYMFDTLKIYRFFRVWLKESLYNVSLYVKRDCDNPDAAWDSKLTLSKMRNVYSGEVFEQNDFDKDMFLSEIISRTASLDITLKEQDIIFDEAIVFKAKAQMNWSKQGKTKPYYIVGAQLEKIR